MKKLFAVLVFTSLLAGVLAVGTSDVFGQSADCVIPDSGPWPPCARGSITQPSRLTDCVIPPSGPWPPCATNGSQTQRYTPVNKPNPEAATTVVTPESFGTDISLGFGLTGACNVVEPIEEWSVADISEKPTMTLAATYLPSDVGQEFTWRLYDPFGVDVLSQTETISGDDGCFTRDIMLPNYYTFGYYQLSITADNTNIFGKMFFFVE